MTRPVVTVVVRTYNRWDLLANAITSVLCQSLYDFELLIIDDFSTDKTTEVVSNFKQHHEKASYRTDRA